MRSWPPGLAALDAGGGDAAWLHGAAGRWAAGGSGRAGAHGVRGGRRWRGPISAADLVDAWGPHAVRSLSAVADLAMSDSGQPRAQARIDLGAITGTT